MPVPGRGIYAFSPKAAESSVCHALKYGDHGQLYAG